MNNDKNWKKLLAIMALVPSMFAMTACGAKSDAGNKDKGKDNNDQPAIIQPVDPEEEGGEQQGGSEQGGSEQGGSEQGGSEQGGSEQGGSEQCGSEQGGSEQGGSEQGGSEQGGSEQGGSEQGGSEQGGSEEQPAVATVTLKATAKADINDTVNYLVANVYNQTSLFGTADADKVKTVAQLTAQKADMKFYVHVADLANIAAVNTVKIGNQAFAKEATTTLSVGNYNKITDKVWYVTDDGKLYVAASVMAFELEINNQIKVNDMDALTITDFVPANSTFNFSAVRMQQGAKGTIAKDGNTWVVTDSGINAGEWEWVEFAYEGAKATDVALTKKIYTYADETTSFDYGLTNMDAGLNNTPVLAFYPVKPGNPEKHQNMTINYAVYIADKGVAQTTLRTYYRPASVTLTDNLKADINDTVDYLVKNVYNNKALFGNQIGQSKDVAALTKEKADMKFYVAVADLVKVNADEIKIGNQVFAKNAMTDLSVGNSNHIIDKVWYVGNDGKLYVAASVMAFELNLNNKIKVGTFEEILVENYTQANDEIALNKVQAQNDPYNKIVRNIDGTYVVTDIATDSKWQQLEFYYEDAVATDIALTKKVTQLAGKDATISYGLSPVEDSGDMFAFFPTYPIDILTSKYELQADYYHNQVIDYSVYIANKGVFNAKIQTVYSEYLPEVTWNTDNDDGMDAAFGSIYEAYNNTTLFGGSKKTLSVAELQEKNEDFTYYVHLANIDMKDSDEEVVSVQIGNQTFTADQEIAFSVGMGNSIKDKVWYIDDGKLYVALMVQQFEMMVGGDGLVVINGTNWRSMSILGNLPALNFTDVEMQNGAEGTVEKDEDGTYVVTDSAINENQWEWLQFKIEDVTLTQGGVFITKKEYTYADGRKTFDYGFTEVDKVGKNDQNEDVYALTFYPVYPGYEAYYHGMTVDYTVFVSDEAAGQEGTYGLAKAKIKVVYTSQMEAEEETAAE